MIKKVNLILVLTCFLIFNSNAQNDDLKLLDDRGYSEISNYISVDLAQLFTPSLTIRYEHIFGTRFSVSGGLKFLIPNREYTFYSFSSFMKDSYGFDDRDYYAEDPPVNFFIEVNMITPRKFAGNSFMGLGYRNTRYDVGVMHDYYVRTGRTFEIYKFFFLNMGIEFGVRNIRFTDIEYNPDGRIGPMLDDYNRSYEDEISTIIILFRPSVGVGYKF